MAKTGDLTWPLPGTFPWPRTDVPDPVLEQAQIAYAEARQKWVTEQLVSWEEQNPAPGKLAGRGKREAWDAARAELVARMDEHRPEGIERTVARPLARLARLFWDCPKELQAEVDQMQFRLPNGRRGTAEQFVKWYALRDVAKVFYASPDQQVLERLRSVGDAVNNLRVERLQRDYMDDGVSQPSAARRAEWDR